MSDYDQACKFAARGLDAAGFLRWVSPPKLLAAYDFAGWLPTETLAMPDEADRHCDTVAGFRHRAGQAPPVAQIVEFQTTPRPILPRLGEYGFRIYREVPYQTDPVVRYEVRLVVVYLTGPRQSGKFASGAVAGLQASLSVRADPVTLSTRDARATVEGVARGEVSRAVLSFVPLLRKANAIVGRWREVVEALPDERDRVRIAFLALTFARLMPWADEWRRGMEGMNVEKSPYWEEIRVGGRVEGRVDQGRASLIRMLGLRFGEPVAAELIPMINRTTELAILDRCLELTVPGDLAQIRTLLSTAR